MSDIINSLSKEEWFALGLAVLGILLIVYGAYSAFRAMQARTWPSVDGTVTISAVEVSYSYEKGRRRKNEKHVFFYEYEVLGQEHTGSTIAFGFTVRSAKTLFRLYPPNKQITVFHDPTNPSVSCLEPGRIVGAIAAIVIGIGVLILAGAIK